METAIYVPGNLCTVKKKRRIPNMTPQIITTLVIIAAMFALMLLNKFPLAVTMTLAGVALWITGIVEPAKLYSSFGGCTDWNGA